jgi:hypothetical protein
MVLTRVGGTQLFPVGYLPRVKGLLLERGVLAQVATAAVASPEDAGDEGHAG